MSLPVLIYSTDKTRGAILLKSHTLNNIKAVLCSTHMEIKAAIARFSPNVIIFDTKNMFWDELEFLKTQHNNLLKTFKIILIAPGNTSILKASGIKNCRCASDPFDPENILSTSKEILTKQAKKKARLAASIFCFAQLPAEPKESFSKACHY